MDLASYGTLAVRLVNTSSAARPDDDVLADLADLRAFLDDRPAWRSRATPADVRDLRSLRIRLREIFVAASADRPATAVDRLNALLATAVIRPQISRHDAESWHLHVGEAGASVAQAYGAAAVMGLAAQLTEVGPERLGVCKAPPCDRVFVDTSTNRSRRYCSDRCATRANVVAYRARRRGGQ